MHLIFLGRHVKCEFRGTFLKRKNLKNSEHSYISLCWVMKSIWLSSRVCHLRLQSTLQTSTQQDIIILALLLPVDAFSFTMQLEILQLCKYVRLNIWNGFIRYLYRYPHLSWSNCISKGITCDKLWKLRMVTLSHNMIHLLTTLCESNHSDF